MTSPTTNRDDHEAILGRYRDALWRLTAGYAYARQDREDLYQDIALAVWQALPRFRRDCSERTFVYRVAHNRGISHRTRAARRAMRPLEDAANPAAEAPTPETASIHRDDLARLRECVRGLPMSYREVVLLRLEGLPTKQIAEIVGISENNVDVRLARARRRLRDQMNASETR